MPLFANLQTQLPHFSVCISVARIWFAAISSPPIMFNRLASGSRLSSLQVGNWRYIFNWLVWWSKTSHSGTVPSSPHVSITPIIVYWKWHWHSMTPPGGKNPCTAWKLMKLVSFLKFSFAYFCWDLNLFLLSN